MKKPRYFLIPELEMYLTDLLPGFLCKRCARCCKSKLIPLYQLDIERIKPQVKEKFYERTKKIEKLITGSDHKMIMRGDKCIFLDKKLCKYYDLRPNTCRRHPFLVTNKHLLVSSTCPGIDWYKHQNIEEYRALSTNIASKIDSYISRIICKNERNSMY